jgi:hypothetical protein
MNRPLATLSDRAFKQFWKHAPEIIKTVKPVACDCAGCKDMCKTAPCMPTPKEAEKILLAGHAKKLVPTTNLAFRQWGVPPIHMLAPMMTEQGCAFLDAVGHCTLHEAGLKPLEGRLSSCQNTLEQHVAIPMAVLQTWTTNR